jgi:putative ABC transport system permease protein
MASFIQQLRQVLRRLSRTPMFTAVFPLALGIGANTAIFSVLHGVLLNPLPYPEPSRLEAVWQTAPGLNIPEVKEPGSASRPGIVPGK